MPDICSSPTGSGELRHLQVHHKHAAGYAYEYVTSILSTSVGNLLTKEQLREMMMPLARYAVDTIRSITDSLSSTMNVPTFGTLPA